MKNKNCNYCYSCDFCNSCDYCNSCNSCDFCDFCDNLVNGFMCIHLKFEKKDEKKYWIFNKEVSKEEWNNRWDFRKPKVCDKCGAILNAK